MENKLGVFTWDDIISGKFYPRSHLAVAGYEGTAVTVGGFDGAHRGHQALFSAVLRQKNLLPGVITFATSPKARFHPETFSGSVYTMEQRLRVFQETGFAFVVVIDFSGDFGKMDGVVFLQHLKERLYMSYLAEGTDFRCGYKGAVTIDFLKDFAEKNQVELEVVEPVIAEGVRISSSEIRRSLLEGDFARCRRFLGRNFALGGSCFQWQWSHQSLLGMRLRDSSDSLQILPPAGRYDVKIHCEVGQKDKKNCGRRSFSFEGRVVVQEESLEMILPAQVYGGLPSTEDLMVQSVEFIG